MSKDKRRARDAAITFLKYHISERDSFVVNRLGHPPEHCSQVEWLMSHGLVRRTRTPGSSPTRRLTMMVITERGRRMMK